jgi:hypothetical protein
MTIATMTDRTLPLAERVLRLVNEGSTLAGVEYAAALDDLLADIAAADRLARAGLILADYRGVRIEPTRRTDNGDTTTLVFDASKWDQAREGYHAALDAYRARMAQGVARG